jgi:hypothetical protein
VLGRSSGKNRQRSQGSGRELALKACARQDGRPRPGLYHKSKLGRVGRRVVSRSKCASWCLVQTQIHADGRKRSSVPLLAVSTEGRSGCCDRAADSKRGSVCVCSKFARTKVRALTLSMASSPARGAVGEPPVAAGPYPLGGGRVFFPLPSRACSSALSYRMKQFGRAVEGCLALRKVGKRRWVAVPDTVGASYPSARS